MLMPRSGGEVAALCRGADYARRPTFSNWSAWLKRRGTRQPPIRLPGIGSTSDSVEKLSAGRV
jgi:hypothetical protein